jgi:Mannitol dehydrogenase C-terminal domain
VAAGVDAGLDVHLVTRESSELPDASRFSALVKGEGGETRIGLPVATFSKADTLETMCSEARDLIVGVPQLLVTASVAADGLEERKGFLLQIAEARTTSSRAEATQFIPCENDPGIGYEELRQQLTSLGVECLDTLVNRLCPKRLVEGTRVEVIADELAEWVIEAELDHRQALAALGELPYVAFVADVRPYETRKRWLVNGGHLALAIVAHAKRIVSIDQAASEPGRADWLAKLHKVLIESLDARWPGLEDNKQYASRHVASWARHEDDVVRIMKRLRRANPVPFLDDLERKLVEPLALLDDAWSALAVRRVFDRLHVVLQRGRSYVDFKDFPSILPTLDRSVDQRTTSRYEELLVPIVGEAAASERAARLGVALDSHRVRG